jgi:hypothetical protein
MPSRLAVARLVASLVVFPSIAVAQRGGGARSQADRHTSSFDKQDAPAGPVLRTRDLEDQSPLKLLIDKRKDLKLTDAQLATLKQAEPKLKDTNAPLLRAVDSLVHDMRAPIGSPSDDDRTRMRNARIGVMATLAELRTNYDAAATEAVATFDADQQAKAKELLAKQREDGDKLVRERLSGGGKP